MIFLLQTYPTPMFVDICPMPLAALGPFENVGGWLAGGARNCGDDEKVEGSCLPWVFISLLPKAPALDANGFVPVCTGTWLPKEAI